MPHQRVVAACLLLAALTACRGGDDTETAVGDVIPARYPDQFEDGKKAVVAVPLGRLVLRVGKPVDRVGSDDTRELAALDAPAGATFVPLTWQYDRGSFEDIADYLDTSAAPVVDLVTEGESYRLPSPDLEAEEGESMYVVVDGDAEDLSMEVEFDRESQTVDLATGKRDEGAARPLYTLGGGGLRTEPCESEDWFDHEENAVATFTCDLTGPALLPYAAGRWADPGHRWLVLTVATDMGRLTVLDASGAAAHYTPRRVAVTATLRGHKPVAVLHAGGGDNACPSRETGACSYTGHLVFDVRTRGNVPDRLTVEQRYQMELFARSGGVDAEPRRTVVGASTLRLEVPARSGDGGGR